MHSSGHNNFAGRRSLENLYALSALVFQILADHLLRSIVTSSQLNTAPRSVNNKSANFFRFSDSSKLSEETILSDHQHFQQLTVRLRTNRFHLKAEKRQAVTFDLTG